MNLNRRKACTLPHIADIVTKALNGLVKRAPLICSGMEFVVLQHVTAGYGIKMVSRQLALQKNELWSRFLLTQQ